MIANTRVSIADNVKKMKEAIAILELADKQIAAMAKGESKEKAPKNKPDGEIQVLVNQILEGWAQHSTAHNMKMLQDKVRVAYPRATSKHIKECYYNYLSSRGFIQIAVENGFKLEHKEE